jgi:RimJ/RimL family protein N-acetyltransferase
MIRIAKSEDAERIAEIHVESWRAAYRGILPGEYLDGLDVSGRTQLWRKFSGNAQEPLFVVEECDQIIGFCHLVRSRDADAERAAEIAAIYLDPIHWRKGYGKELCSAALSFSAKQGFERVTLWVLEENSTARRFYETIGFTADGATKTEEGPGFSMNEVRYWTETN